MEVLKVSAVYESNVNDVTIEVQIAEETCAFLLRGQPVLTIPVSAISEFGEILKNVYWNVLYDIEKRNKVIENEQS